MIVYAEYPVNNLLAHVGSGKPKIELGDFLVNTTGVRLECLRRSQTCVVCGKSGTVWRLETHHKSVTPHLNLYHVDAEGEYWLMTRDHILAKSRGGSDLIDNMQTMCFKCNEEKGASPWQKASTSTNSPGE